MGKNLIIVGNGFDLDVGYKTRYSDFVNSNQWPLKERNSMRLGEPTLENFILDFTDNHMDELNHVKWIDIEELLRDYALSKNSDNYNQDISEYDYTTYNRIVKSFADYLWRAMRNHERIPSHYLPSYEIVRAMASCKNNWEGYTFNYSDTAGLISFMASENGHRGFLVPFTHIHGEIDMYSSENTIILGIDDAVKIPREYKFLRKTWNKHFLSHNLDKDMMEADIIVCFGFSFGRIDIEYFRSFFKEVVDSYVSTKPKREIHIITYNESSRRDIMENFESIGISMTSLKRAFDFQFYMTGEIGKTKDAHDRFQELYRKISSH